MSSSPGRTTSGWHQIRDAVGSRLWPLPVLGILVALGLGVAVPELDNALSTGGGEASRRFAQWLAQWTFSGGADAARDVLAAIAGSVVTVTSLTFSLTVVTLQLASSQFSPRLLRTFSADRFVQVTLAAFLGTFVYTLTVLRTVRVETDTAPAVVPHASITLAYLAAVVDVVLLVAFLAHLAREIRVEPMLARVHRSAEATLLAGTVARDPDGGTRDVPAVFDTDDDTWQPLPAGGSGFVTGIDHDALVRLADEHDLLLDVHCDAGSTVAAGAPLGRWRPTDPNVRPGQDSGDAVRDVTARAIRTGVERTSAQDVGYGLRQLVDVALKALSSGINDPTTAVHAIGHVGTLLGQYAGRTWGPMVLDGAEDRPRVVIRRATFPQLLDVGVSGCLHYGDSDPDVLVRIAELLGEVGWTLPAPERPAVEAQLDRLDARLAAADFDAAERDRVQHAVDGARERLTGRVGPYRPVPIPR
ncbi:DUF2254 domain-containing protein [Nakamurella flava]|uniref:DUF2254 domain-containing protein n=1 Tax=Nakamurella flava TaxID=2576308 RepID=A0A4U6QKC4_9ACTN|nr:DUF2254 domain-containing protein [Nakamurella flava]TKV60903.1 DUF2254 domain-containing protein [Nakamurella flava]